MTAVRGGYTTQPLSVSIGRMINGAKLANTAEAERFALKVAKPLKAEALKAAAKVFGSDLKPFKNRNVRARVFDEIIYTKPTASQFSGFKLIIFLKPAEIWAVGEWGTYDHLVGMPKGYGAGRSMNNGYTSFGQLNATAKRVSKKKKAKPVFLNAPGYMHPVRGPIVVKGIEGRGAIKYAFKLVRQAETEVVSTAWRNYMSDIIRKSF